MTNISVKRATDGFSVALPASPSLWRLAKAEDLYKLDTLLEGGLYMTRLDQFQDSREGALGRKSTSLLDKAPAYEKQYIIRQYKNARRQSFASCWHTNDKEPSEYVWELFGGCHTGYAIRTTPQNLLKAVEPVVACGAGYIGDITYKNHNRQENKIGNILDAHFVVRDEYKDEEEARFLIHTFGPCGQLLYGQEGPKGQLLKWRLRKTTPPSHECVGGYRRGTAILLSVDPKQLIDEIVVGKFASPALFEDIERRALDTGISYRRE